MSLQNSCSFATNFTDSVSALNLGMQANGTTTTASSSPAGISGHIGIVNSTYQSTIFSTDATTVGGIRSEIYFGQSAPGNFNSYYVQFLVNRADWDNGSSGVCSIMQIHCSDLLTAANNFVLGIINDRLIGFVPQADPASENNNTALTYVDLGAMIYGGWHSLCVRALWENSDTGTLEVLIDNITQYKLSNKGTCYASDTPYLKLGCYDAFHTNTFGNYRTVYYKNAAVWQGIADGYEQILGVGNVPQPIPIGINE